MSLSKNIKNLEFLIIAEMERNFVFRLNSELYRVHMMQMWRCLKIISLVEAIYSLPCNVFVASLLMNVYPDSSDNLFCCSVSSSESCLHG